MDSIQLHETPRGKTGLTRYRLAGFLALAILSSGAIGAVSGCSVTSGQETTGEYVDDATITTKVKSALASDGGTDLAGKVGVETGQGVVQLSGFVPSAEDKAKAEQITLGVKGVQSVKNDLVIQ